LGDALEAIYESRWSFQSLVGAGVANGGRRLRLWVVRPDRLRSEDETDDGALIIVHAGTGWWMSHPKHGSHAGNDDEATLGNRGALVDLLDPTPLLGLARLEVIGEEEVAGRAVIRMRATPRSGEEIHAPGWSIGPDGIEVAIDRDRGIALRAGSIRYTHMVFDADIPAETFSMEFPGGEIPKEARVLPPRPVSLEQAKDLVGFPILVPSALPEGSRLVRCVLPAEDPADGVHLSYVVDPGARSFVEVSVGPRVLAEEPSAWPDWRVVREGGVDLRVREDRGESWYRATALVERDRIGMVVSSALSLDAVVAMALSLEPLP